jgi:hypothetical protein
MNKTLIIELAITTFALWVLNGWQAVVASVLLILTCTPLLLFTGWLVVAHKRRRHNG